MAIALWIIIAIVIALLANTLRGHNTTLNTVASFVGALGVGGTYSLIVKASDTSILDALTKVTWENSFASIVGALALVILAQLFTLEREKYRALH